MCVYNVLFIVTMWQIDQIRAFNKNTTTSILSKIWSIVAVGISKTITFS